MTCCGTTNGQTTTGHVPPINTGTGYPAGVTGGPTGGQFVPTPYFTGNPFTPTFATPGFWPTGSFQGPTSGETFGGTGVFGTTPFGGNFWNVFNAFCQWYTAACNGQTQFGTPGFTNGYTNGITNGFTPNFFGTTFNTPTWFNTGTTPTPFTGNAFNPWTSSGAQRPGVHQEMVEFAIRTANDLRRRRSSS